MNTTCLRRDLFPSGTRLYCQQRHETRPPGRFRRGLPPCSVASLLGPPMAAVNRGGGQPGALYDVAGGERASSRHRAAGAAPLGGSNRLLTVDELAAYLGVPKKTVYGCWRACGLRGYRVGRRPRFRERHV